MEVGVSRVVVGWNGGVFYGAYFGKESAVMIFVAAPHRCFKAQLIRLLRRDLR